MDPGLRRDDQKEGPAGRERATGGKAIRSPILTIFLHCGFAAFSFRTAWKRAPATNRQWFWPRIGLLKGLAMLIRSEKYGVQGGAANAARPEAIPAASLPTLLLGGLLLLIGP